MSLEPRTAIPPQRSFADLHTHSSASFDSLSHASKMMAKAVSLGLTHLAITDHERIDGAQRAAQTAPPGLQLIVGEEIRTADGDMLGLFLQEVIPPGLSAAETAAAMLAKQSRSWRSWPLSWTMWRSTTRVPIVMPTRWPALSPSATGCLGWPPPTLIA